MIGKLSKLQNIGGTTGHWDLCKMQVEGTLGLFAEGEDENEIAYLFSTFFINIIS